jgi:hypothetical protein
MEETIAGTITPHQHGVFYQGVVCQWSTRNQRQHEAKRKLCLATA